MFKRAEKDRDREGEAESGERERNIGNCVFSKADHDNIKEVDTMYAQIAAILISIVTMPLRWTSQSEYAHPVNLIERKRRERDSRQRKCPTSFLAEAGVVLMAR